MKRRTFLINAASSMAAIAGEAWGQAKSPADEDRRLSAMLDSFLTQILRESPESATSLGLDVGARDTLRARLNDRTAEALEQQHSACLARLTDVSSIDRELLTEPMRVTFDATRVAHQLAAEGGRFGFGANSLRDVTLQTVTPYVVTQMTGSFFEIPQFLESEHPINDADDAGAHVSRLEQFADALDAETARLRADQVAGVVPPAFILDTVIEQLTAVLRAGAGDWTLVRSFARRAAAQGIGSAPAERAVRIVERRVFPALSRQLAALQVARKSAAEGAGLGRLPSGERYYAWALQVATTTALDADAIHRLGREQSAEIEAKMHTLLRQLGLTSGSVGERMAALGADPRFLFSNDDPGRVRALDYVRDLVARARSQLARVSRFDLRADMRVERVPPEIELGAAGAYVVPGAIDGSRPPIYYLNLRNVSEWPMWALPTLTYHEALPGHGWQEAVGNERQPAHAIRAFLKFTAYSEGWGLYAEQLADEIGLHEGDMTARLGFLQAQQLRASRLIVDTGLHARGWSRAQAVEWMVNATGRERQAMVREVDRYCAKPGQACSYNVGKTEIVRLRALAQAALGAAFELQTFNDWVLGAGNVPLAVLGNLIKQKIAASRRPSQ